MTSILTRVIVLFLTIVFASCAKQMAEQNVKADSTALPPASEQMGAATAPKQSSEDIIEVPENQIPDSIRQKLLNSMSSKDIPIGSMLQLRAQVLSQFHPKVKDFTLTKN